MNCKERILSNDYADIIIDYVLPEEQLAVQGFDYCFSAIDDEFGVAYLDRRELPPISVGVYTYTSVPKLYGPMQNFQAESLVETGNLQIQGPPLSLKGEGVILGFVDTGEGVMVLQQGWVSALFFYRFLMTIFLSGKER
ncbi:MAG: hypothetical protein NC341_05275 [Blautia sp.]|nr:hypothetical protein [Blautia sp.]MCM1199641.1 hypothetical protein [Bacteroides fragilis]